MNGIARALGAALVLAAAAACSSADTGNAEDPANGVGERGGADCEGLPNTEALARLLRQAPDSGEAGGLFHGRSMWGAVVSRAGNLCAFARSTDSLGGIWPGSQQIAKAKAFTANAFSTDTLAFSTARMYTLAQPGHSLYGIFQPHTFDPECMGAPSSTSAGSGRRCGGAIAFGGGVALYRNGRIVGGLGVSGDTPCTDHEIAKRVRHLAGLDPAKGMLADDITYSSADGASVFTHPLCANTYRNGTKFGEEPPATGY